MKHFAWIRVNGPPQKKFSDNEAEFNNDEVRDVTENVYMQIDNRWL